MEKGKESEFPEGWGGGKGGTGGFPLSDSRPAKNPR